MTRLEVDDELDRWTFNDFDLDSGTFHEVVSRGIVEKVDGEYQVADVGVVNGVEVSVDSQAAEVDAPTLEVGEEADTWEETHAAKTVCPPNY